MYTDKLKLLLRGTRLHVRWTVTGVGGKKRFKFATGPGKDYFDMKNEIHEVVGYDAALHFAYGVHAGRIHAIGPRQEETGES